MTAQKRLAALETELAEIESEIETLTERHAEAVASGDDARADDVHERLAEARGWHAKAEARRTPLERAVEAEEATARAKEAETLTADADARLEALESKIAEASKAAEKLAAICDDLDQNAALHWAVAARKASEAGGSPARRHLAGINETLDRARMAARKLGHVSDDFQRRSVTIPVQTKSRAA